MYTSNNNQQSQQQDRFPPGFYTMKAKTKVRRGLDGQTNRGILITDGVNDQWLTIPANNEVCKLSFGSKVYYHGHNARPSLTFGKGQANNPNFDNGGVMPQTNQGLADYYAKLAGQEATQAYQSPVDEPDYYNQSENNVTIDEELISKNCLVMSNSLALLRELNPGLSEESLVKMSISISINYFKQKENLVF